MAAEAPPPMAPTTARRHWLCRLRLQPLNSTAALCCLPAALLLATIAADTTAAAAAPFAIGQTPLTSCAHPAPTKLCNYQDVPALECSTGSVVRPTTVADVQAAVVAAVAAKQRVRAIGHAHSDNSVFCDGGNSTDDTPSTTVTLLMDSLSDVVDMPSARSAHGDSVASLRAGIELGAALDALDTSGLALACMYPAYRNLTLGGILGTAAHGSSLTMPNSLGGCVTALEIVNATGGRQWLSARDADTRPFRATTAGLGSTGVIVTVNVTVRRQYKLRVTQTQHPASFLLSPTPLAIARNASTAYATFAWFPHTRRVLAQVGTTVDTSTPGEGADTLMDQPPLFFEAFAALNELALLDPPLQCWLENQTFNGQWSSPPYSDPNATAGNPHIVTGWSHRMMAGTCAQGDCPWQRGVHIHDQEFSLPLANLTAAVQALTAYTNPAKAGNDTLCVPLQGIYFRFGGATDGFIDAGAGVSRAGGFVVVELASWRPYGAAARPHEHVYSEVAATLQREFGGRPHWGKNDDATFAGQGDELARLYGDGWGTWWRTRDGMDPGGTFLSPFVASMRPRGVAPAS